MAALGPRLLQAQEVPRSHLYDRFQATVSGTVLYLGTNIPIDPDSGEGTEIDVGDNLGIGSTTLQPRLALRWRGLELGLRPQLLQRGDPGNEQLCRHQPHRQDQVHCKRLALRRGVRVLGVSGARLTRSGGDCDIGGRSKA